MTEPIVLTLVVETWTQDSIGQHVPTYTERDIFGERESVTRAEWSAAGEQGLNPQYKVNVFAGDYEGERIVRMQVGSTKKTFAVYRTYKTGDLVELYLEWKTGDGNYVEPEPEPEPEPAPGGEPDGD